MKNKLRILTFTLLIGILSGCEEYLSIPSDATLTEDVIFSSYKTFQGYIDPCYSLICDANSMDLAITNNIGTESVSNLGASPVTASLNQNYFSLVNNGSRSIWIGFEGSNQNNLPMDAQKKGLYHWWPYGSRIANLALQNLKYLKDATPEEKNKIEGQALFFRAYLHFEVARAFGSVPYHDKVYNNGEEAELPRYWTDSISGKKDFQAVAEKAARDLQRAAELLPLEWDDSNIGRITKGAAFALKSKVLLYAASPLFEESSVKRNSTVTAEQTGYNKDYLKRAAEAAAEVIKLGKYDLPVWGGTTGDYAGDGYRKNFTTIDGKVPYTNECIFQRWNHSTNSTGQFLFRDRLCRIYVGQGLLAIGNAGHLESPLQRYMDKFEMKDGSQYKPGNQIDGGFDDDLDKFNNQRDPRFQYNYRTHGEKIGAHTTYFDKKGTVYSPDARGPFLMTKYWYPLVDNVNQTWGQFLYRTPSIRYADLLLFYAEAVFESTGNPDASIGVPLTARQALNMVRKRALMPDNNPVIYSVARTTHGELSTDDPFRLAYRNERCVELAYEGHYWFDMRRWKRISLLEKQVWILDFSRDYKLVSRTVLQPYLFELRNYWLPFPTTHTQIFVGYPQNPGW